MGHALPACGPARSGEPVSGGATTGDGRLWGGRFVSGPTDALLALSRSVDFDWRLAPFDLRQTLAHARVLHRAGLLTTDELARVEEAVSTLTDAIVDGDVVPDATDEDVHGALERILIDRLGELGGKLRAGRSRNDQIATDLRLYLRAAAGEVRDALVDLCRALMVRAGEQVDTIAPGYTHLQRAQPVSLGHELAKHVHAFLRDLDRFTDWDRRADVCPLGSGALSGSGLPLDPEAVAADLGFSRSAGNSIDAVSDRDFAAEFLFVAAMIGIHLSRLGEEICLWSSQEFGFAMLADEWSTGSSIMPQKKNPDVAELARGKAGRLIGDLTGLLATLKALPFAYNRDLQEDKEPVFDAVDTLLLVLPAMSGLVSSLRFNSERMGELAPGGHSLATEIADWLVRRGIPFRTAHEVAGGCVARADELGCELWELSDADLAAVSSSLTPEVRDVLSAVGALASRRTAGGSAPDLVRRQLEELSRSLEAASR